MTNQHSNPTPRPGDATLARDAKREKEAEQRDPNVKDGSGKERPPIER